MTRPDLSFIFQKDQNGDSIFSFIVLGAVCLFGFFEWPLIALLMGY